MRELENVIYRSAVIAGGEAILGKDSPIEVRSSADSSTRHPFPTEGEEDAVADSGESESISR